MLIWRLNKLFHDILQKKLLMFVIDHGYGVANNQFGRNMISDEVEPFYRSIR